MKNNLIENLWQELILPSGYQVMAVKTVTHDQQQVSWHRYQKTINNHLGGEHISFTLNGNQLQGLSVMDASLQHGSLPTESEAKQIAVDFMAAYAPDLVNDLELKWIAEHEEIISINDKNIILCGMKVKYQIKSTGKFSWVIVGKNNLPMVFERDIIWNYDMSQRQTEKWLHDQWLKERGIS